MLFANDDDDADFIPQTGSSKLANLFSGNDSTKAGNSSLTYTPPRQPSVGKASDKQSSSSGSLSLIHAAAVQAFKYEGKKPSNQGRLGIAVIGNHETANYKLILYKEKQQQVAFAPINAQFVIKVQGNGFLNFIDEKRSNWSVKFENEEAVVNFTKQVVLAKAQSHGAGLADLDHVISQDLVLGEGDGDGLKLGNTALIKYTAWVLADHNLKKVLDTTDIDEPQKVKLGKGKQVKGLEEGLVGCKKNSRRLLVVPPSCGFGTKGSGSTIPPNSVLVYDVWVGAVSKSKSATKESTPRSSTPVSIAAEDGDKRDARAYSHSSVEEPPRSRTSSVPSEQPAPPATASGGESDRARLLSRMAKMGAQMLLPMPGAVPAQPSSDSEPEGEQPPPAPRPTNPVAAPSPQPTTREGSPKPMVKPRTFSQHLPGEAAQPQIPPMQPMLQPLVSPYPPGLPPTSSAMSTAQHLALYQAQTQLAGAMAAYPYQQQSPLLLPHSYPAAAAPSATSAALDAQLPLLLSETRSQNTEVRLNISKLADKVDAILGKLDTLKPQLPPAPPLSSYMDSEALLHNIQRIVQENIKLKEENGDKNSKIQALNEKICDLLQRNQRLMEESNTIFEQRSDSLHSSAVHSQTRLLALEAEKMQVAERLEQALSELSSLKAELAERQQVEFQASRELGELRTRFEGKETVLQTLEESLKEAESQKQDLESKVAACESKIANLAPQLKSLEESLAEKDAALADEQRKAVEEIGQLKSLHQKEIELLQAMLHQQGAENSPGKTAELEESVAAKWKATYEAETAELRRSLEGRASALEAEKLTLLQTVQELESKCHQLLSSGDQQKQLSEQKIKELQEENRALRNAQPSTSAASSFDAELKKIMNTLFKLLQREFSTGETYSRQEATRMILNIIRDYTTEVLERRQASSAHTHSTATNHSSEPTPGAASSAPTSPPQPQLNKSSEAATKLAEEKCAPEQALSSSSSSSPSPVAAPNGDPASSHPNSEEEAARPPPENAKVEASNGNVAPADEGGSSAQVEVAQSAKDGSDNQADGSTTPAGLKPGDVVQPSEDAGPPNVPPQDKNSPGPQAENKKVDSEDWSWKPQPPPPPLFDEFEDDDWLN